MAVMPSGNELLVAYLDGEARTGLLDLASGELTELRHLRGLVHNALDSHPDGGRFIASSGAAGADLYGYTLREHFLDGRASRELAFPDQTAIVWRLCYAKDGAWLLVHQGSCVFAASSILPASGGPGTPVLEEFALARDASWGRDGHIYFASDGDLWRK